MQLTAEHRYASLASHHYAIPYITNIIIILMRYVWDSPYFM